MANHLELLHELQQLDKVPSLERLRAAQKRRAQQLKRWAAYEKEMQSKRRKADKQRRGGGGPNALHADGRKRVSFSASVALLEASARNDADEGKLCHGPLQTEHGRKHEVLIMQTHHGYSGVDGA